MTKILHRWTGAVVYESPKDTLREAVFDAIAAGAVLTGAVLRGAVLTGAVLRGAVLTGAVLRGAVLTDADLRDAVLTGADLTGAVLRDADLRGADLRGAVLRDAVLTGADLRGAKNLSPHLRIVRDDLRIVLAATPAEVPGLLAAVREGRINGSAYEGECACLVGTIANVRGCAYTGLPELRPDSGRPAEQWFLSLMPGHTPDVSIHAALTVAWIEEWLREQAHGA